MQLRVLDLFSGLGGWSAPARERGHHVVRVELELRLEAEVHADILTLTPADLPGPWDLILASPPCEAFSVMVIGRNWYHDGRPKTGRAEHGLRLVEHTRWLIDQLDPTFFLIENPMGKLRKLPVMAGLERRSVVYCSYGETRRKETDLFSNRWPPSLRLHPTCKNGDPCHVAAPRGSRTGTQGMPGERNGYFRKSLIPYALASDVLDAVERDLGISDRPLPAPPGPSVLSFGW